MFRYEDAGEPEEGGEPATGKRAAAASGARRFGVGATAGAVVALIASTALAAQGVSLPGDPAGEPLPLAYEIPVGACLNWNSADAGDATRVNCQSPHLFEVVGVTDVEDQYGPAAALPTDQSWREVVQDKCAPLAGDYLGGGYDPNGRYEVGALKPSQHGWRSGDRTLHCGLQVNAHSAALFHTEGSVKQAEQADVYPPGTCLGLDGISPSDPVDCTEPHALEIVGVVDLGVLLETEERPTEAKQNQELADFCSKMADEYVGGKGSVAKKSKKLVVYWDTLRPESWAAGTRKVNCKLAALLPDKSGFAPITGSVLGKIKIGTKAAPPAPETVTPGEPAPSPPVPSTTTSSQAPSTATEPTTAPDNGGS